MGPRGEKHSPGSRGGADGDGDIVVGWTRESLGSGIWGSGEAWYGQAHSRGSLVWNQGSGIVPPHSWLAFEVRLQGFGVNFVGFFNGNFLRKAGSLAGKPE